VKPAEQQKNQQRKGGENMEKLMRLVKGEEGVTAIEYGLIASLIAIVILVALTTTGTNLNAKFGQVAGALT
jgi:pilus assembly protein Flp/PilA